MIMALSIFFVCLSFVSVNAINRPVYKIILTQKGYAQFLQYDVETPPLREFTFCTWIRVYDIKHSQSIFSYVGTGNNRMVRLWLDTGGRYMKLSIKRGLTSYFPVEIVQDVWYHVCLSYQSDYGAWALYIDSRVVSCEASQTLNGFVLPGGGSIIIGYGNADDGASNGFEGEIFGASMILISTIERNFTLRNNPQFEQTLLPQNKVKNEDKNLNNYIILSNLQSGDVHNNFENIVVSPPVDSKSNEKKQTLSSFIKHDVDHNKLLWRPIMIENSEEKEILDFTVSDKFRTTGENKTDSCNLVKLMLLNKKFKIPTKPNSEVSGSGTRQISFVSDNEPPDFDVVNKFHTTENDKIEFWNLLNRAPLSGKFKFITKPESEILVSSTRELPMVSEHETPPPPGPQIIYFDKSHKIANPSLIDSLHKLKESSTESGKKTFSKKRYSELSEIETPPPIDKDTKVYGQWTSSKHAGTANFFLKSIDLQNKIHNTKKVPHTIPLTKISDYYPYASNFKVPKLRSHPQFSSRNLVEKSNIVKRNLQMTVQILENDLRNNILKIAQTRPKQVEITNRGETNKLMHDRFYRNVNYGSFEKFNSVHGDNEPKPLMMFIDEKKNHRYFNIPNQKIKPDYPFLKPLEYLIADSENTDSQAVIKSEDMYTKTLANANKWHNVKSYNNDYTPRRINIELQQSEIDHNQQHPTIRLKYNHDKLVEENVDSTIVRGRQLAIEVSNQSNDNKDSVNSLKFNHTYFPNHKNMFKVRPDLKTNPKEKTEAHLFNEHVKIGNALNERHDFRSNENPNKQSFAEGHNISISIPDFRSAIVTQNARDPLSHSSRPCTSIELNNYHLYVQQDESIGMTHILSPLRPENLAMQFILQNYKKCSLVESFISRNAKLLIDWSTTPVHLFGGAYPRTTTDLCGFF